MADNAGTHKNWETALKIIFVFSECFLLFSVSVFRDKRVLLFLAIHFILISIYWLCRNKNFILPFSDKRSTAFASFMAIMVFCEFYLNSIEIRPRTLQSVAAIFGNIISYESFIAISSIGLGILSFYALYVFANTFIEKVFTPLALIAKKYKWHVLALFAIFSVGFFSVLRSNYYYIDDIGRAVNGNGLTGGFSRYLSDVLAEVLHVNVWLADVSPITQLVALLILAFTGAVILHIVYGESSPKVFNVVSLIPLGLSPYFLSCLSFKYDAPYMAFSIFVSIIPFLFYKKNDWRYGIAIYLSMVCMCTTYQASAGIFPACVLLIAFLMWINKQDLKYIGKFIGISVIGYMAGLLSFRYILMAPTNTAYVDTSISFKNIFFNIGQYFHVLNNDYGAIWKLCVFIIILVFSVYVIVSSRRNRLITTALLIVMLVSTFILTYGVNIVFEKPTTDARGIYAIGILIAIIGTFTLSIDKKYLSVSAIVILSWMCIVFSTIYGNALSLQKDYTAYRMEQVLDDINELRVLENKEDVKLQFAGTEWTNTAVRNLTNEYPVLKRLMPILFDDNQDYYWGPKQVCGFYEEALGHVQIIYSKNYDLQEYSLVKETTNYTIYQNDESVLVYLHNENN